MRMRGRPIVLAALVSLHATARAQTDYTPVPLGKVRSQPYSAYSVTDSLGRQITFYLSEGSSDAPRPLIVYVHGSGHASHFQLSGGRIVPTNGHATLTDLVASRARVLIVEKSGVSRFESGDGAGSAAFREEHTLERWTEAVSAATIAASRVTGVDSTRILVVGHPEGGLVAAQVAARLSALSHVGLLAGGGPSQLFDLLLLARAGAFFSTISEDPAVREAFVLAQWDSILGDPESTERAFLGHPYRRWASFLHDSPINQLRQTRAQLFLAQGTDDRAVTRESFEALVADLAGAGRHPTVRLVPDADHSFVIRTPGRAPEDGWRAVLKRVLDWYLRGRATAEPG